MTSGLHLSAGGSMAGIADPECPKIIEWDDLQQELARLCSLSAALREAKDRKESLAHRLDPLVKVRRESLCQSNELEDMRQNLEIRKLAMGDLLLRIKKVVEDVSTEREQLCLPIRSLLVAAKALSAAHQKLQEANKLLGGKDGHGDLKNLQKILRTRQHHMIAQVNSLYPVKDLNEKTSREKFDLHSRGDHMVPSSNVSKPPQTSLLVILGLQLTVPPMKKMSLFTDKKEAQRSASALCYVAHAVSLVASYLDVPLRYPLRLGGSRSFVNDYAPSTESDLGSSPTLGTNGKPTEFPLFLEGQDTTRSSYAIFLLNKDLEQLLNYIGAESLGPRRVLENLKELMRIILSPNFINQ